MTNSAPLLALPLMEDFYTIQGEGFHAGTAAYFLRIGGCDVGCVWCDVKESWEAAAHPPVEISEMVRRVEAVGARFCVITGGEPALYNLDPLTQALQARGIETALETSGAYPLSGVWHWVCFSPKKFKTPDPSVYAQADELKVVVYNRHDFEWAESHAARVKPGCRLFLQPEWSREKQLLPLLIEYVKKNPQWRISLQTHKYMNIP